MTTLDKQEYSIGDMKVSFDFSYEDVEISVVDKYDSETGAPIPVGHEKKKHVIATLQQGKNQIVLSEEQLLSLKNTFTKSEYVLCGNGFSMCDSSIFS